MRLVAGPGQALAANAFQRGPEIKVGRPQRCAARCWRAGEFENGGQQPNCRTTPNRRTGRLRKCERGQPLQRSPPV